MERIALHRSQVWRREVARPEEEGAPFPMRSVLVVRRRIRAFAMVGEGLSELEGEEGESRRIWMAQFRLPIIVETRGRRELGGSWEELELELELSGPSNSTTNAVGSQTSWRREGEVGLRIESLRTRRRLRGGIWEDGEEPITEEIIIDTSE